MTNARGSSTAAAGSKDPEAFNISAHEAGPHRASLGSVDANHDDLVLWADTRQHSVVGRRDSTLGAPHEGHSGWLAGVGHIICANVGAGVLSLPNAVAWLGWIAGPVMIALLTGTAMLCAELLTYAYRAKGQRRATYKDAVTAQLGPKLGGAIVAFLYLKYFLVTIGYTVVAATAMSYIAHWGCVNQGKAPGDSCFDQVWAMVLIFSGLQLLMSQLPNLESVAGASAVGAATSVMYTIMALGLCFTSVSNRAGSARGRDAPPLDKALGVFNAIGSILFANASAVLTIDIQHTLREPPPNEKSMRRVVRTAFGVAMGLYVATGTAGYLAVGDKVGADILVEFEEAPNVSKYIPLFANILTVLHFIPAYQVFAQPLFVVLEQAIIGCVPKLAQIPEWPTRLVYRSLYVALTATIASVLPFFGAISGLIGAIAFFPTVVLGPILMFLSIKKPGRRVSAALIAIMCTIGVLALAALIGSAYGFVRATRNFKILGGAGAPH